MVAHVAALVLAAGQSRRMGSCKQLLPLEGKTVLARSLETLLAGGIGEVIVVAGPAGDAVAHAAKEYPARVVHTSDPDGDMANSIRTGRDALSARADGVVIALCDYPLVTQKTIAELIAAHGREREKIWIPLHNGRKGHPLLLPRPLLDELNVLPTLRDLVRSDPARVRLLEVADPGVLLDMDTPEDYRQIVELSALRDASHSSCLNT